MYYLYMYIWCVIIFPLTKSSNLHLFEILLHINTVFIIIIIILYNAHFEEK